MAGQGARSGRCRTPGASVFSSTRATPRPPSRSCAMTLDPAFRGPWRLPPNRVYRFYRGGALLEQFRAGEAAPDTAGVDSDRPEDWVGSATHAWTPPGRPPTEDGLPTDELLAAMHERPTQPGDVWWIPPGLPHAIGAGIFMLEIEEPSDFSIVAETGGLPIDRADAHLGLGWEVTIDAFDRRAHDDEYV